MRIREGKITLLNVKPTVGFTLPWAGVTPAPNVKRRCGTSSLLELLLCHSRAKRRIPDLFWILTSPRIGNLCKTWSGYFPSPCKGEDEGEGPHTARSFARDSRFWLFSEGASRSRVLAADSVVLNLV
jgi:hypothetical protein